MYKLMVVFQIKIKIYDTHSGKKKKKKADKPLNEWLWAQLTFQDLMHLWDSAIHAKYATLLHFQ